MLALLYDVHGNLAALEAVLDDARAQGVDDWLIGGDVGAFGPWPEATVERLRTLDGARWVRGNHERWAVEGDEVPPIPFAQHGVAASRKALGPTLVAELYALPLWQPLPGGGEAWHASPRSDVDGFLPQPQDHDGELLEGRAPGLLVVGHTHLPTDRTVTRPDGGATRIFNPGSVGLPFDGDPRASYAILRDDGTVESRRVAYDVGRVVAETDRRWGDAAWARTMDETYRTGRPASF